MKILHTSDWHLGKSLYDMNLLDDQEFMLREIIRVAGEERCGAVVIAGDIYDRSMPSTAATQLYDFFLSRVAKDMGIPVIAIAGNHDSAGRLEFGSGLYRSAGYYVFGYQKRLIEAVVLSDSFGDVRFYPIPYLHPADIRALFEDAAIKTYDDAYRTLLSANLEFVEPSARNIAIAHGFFSDLSAHEQTELITSDSEISIGGMDIADASRFDVFDYTALGHLHCPQWTKKHKIRCSGSPFKYSLSEQNHEKSVTLVDIKGKGDISFSVIPISQKRDVRVIRGTFEQLCEPSYHKNTSFDDYVFAEISGAMATYPMEKLRVLFPNILGLSFETLAGNSREINLSPIRGKVSVEELFMRFYRDIRGEDMPAAALETLRSAIADTERQED